MIWTLEEYGDDAERRFWGYLKHTFSNYEVFWATFVHPLREHPEKVRLRSSVDPLLQLVAEAHYSVFHHLVTVHRFLDRIENLENPEKRCEEAALLFDAMLFHLSAATEMAEDFLFAWARIYEEVKDISSDDSFFSPWDEGRVMETAQRYFDAEYESNLEKFRNGGPPVRIMLHNKSSVLHDKSSPLKGFLVRLGNQVDDARINFATQSRRVREYRNKITHNPVLGKLMKEKKLWVPRRERIRDYDRWATVQTSSPHDVSGDFVEATELVDALLHGTEKSINVLWQEIIPHLKKLADSPKYRDMMGISQPSSSEDGGCGQSWLVQQP